MEKDGLQKKKKKSKTNPDTKQNWKKSPKRKSHINIEEQKLTEDIKYKMIIRKQFK